MRLEELIRRSALVKSGVPGERLTVSRKNIPNHSAKSIRWQETPRCWSMKKRFAVGGSPAGDRQHKAEGRA